MSEAFDPYYKWLGIPPAEQPPNHYRLLGVTLFESDLDVIANAAEQRIGHVRAFQIGKHSDESQQILRAISAARVCLLNADKKAEYDTGLRSAATNAELRTIAASAPTGQHQGPRKSKPTYLLLVGGLAVAIAVVAFAIGLLSSGNKDGPQTVAKPAAVKPSPGASVSDTGPSAPVEASPSPAEQLAAQDPSAPKPEAQPQPKESGAVAGPLPGEAQKIVSEKEPGPPAAVPIPAVKTEPATQPPPALPENVPPTPPEAETLEQAEQRLNADLAQASATAARAIAQDALVLADKAILASQAELAKRLALLALKGARKSNLGDLVSDATLLMSELDQPISDALKDKARQRLSKQ